MRYRSKFTYQWSEAIAYSVGLMASDGCLQSDGRHLDLTSKDLQQLDNFQKAIGKTIKVGLKHNSSGQAAYRVQFGDVAYFDFLLSIGLTPAKSKTISDLNIPDEYYTHFLRGLFDGDGTSYAYIDPRWRASYLYYLGFASASEKFLIYLRSNNQRVLKVKGSSIRRSLRGLALVYAKSDAYKIYISMYKDAKGLFLERKRRKLESFISQNGDDTIA